jgi:hypothetical protein
MNGTPPKQPPKKLLTYFIIIMIILATIGFIVFPRGGGRDKIKDIIEDRPYVMVWNEPYAFHEEGYEPSIASDSQG